MNKILLVMLLPIMLLYSASAQVQEANIISGYADLSKIDINKIDKINLSGKWEVIPDTIVQPKNIDNFQRYLVTVPSLWNDSYELNNIGVSTLIVKLKLSKVMESYGLELQKFHSAFRIFVDGAEVGSSGNPATIYNGYFHKETYNPMFFTAKDSVMIVMHVANYTSTDGGFTDPLYLISHDKLLSRYRLLNFHDTIFSTYLILIAIFFFVYSYLFRNISYPLYSGIIALLIFVQNMFMGNQMFSFLLPNIHEIIENRIQFTGFIFLNLALVLYMNSFYKNRVSYTFLKILLVLTFVFTTLIWYFGPLQIDKIFSFFLILYFIVIGYSVQFLYKMCQYENRYSKLLLASFITVFVAGLVDSFFFFTYSLTYNFVMYSMVIFSFTQIIILILRHKEKDAIKNIRKSILRQQNIELMNSKKEINLQVDERTKKLKEALARNQKSNNAKTEFLSTMSHELRTPMNGVIGMTELLLMDNPTFSQKEYLGIIKDSSYTLLKLINDILDLSKIESGNLTIKETSENLKLIADTVIENNKIDADKKELAVSLNYDNILFSNYFVDFQRVSQILNNLVENAIKFTHRGSVVITIERVSREELGDKIKFGVRDTGIGIPPKKLEHIFEIFTQVDTGISRNYEGSGLGLNITKKIVEALGGVIEVNSIHNEGSLFSFIIELRRDEKVRNKLGFSYSIEDL